MLLLCCLFFTSADQAYPILAKAKSKELVKFASLLAFSVIISLIIICFTAVAEHVQ